MAVQADRRQILVVDDELDLLTVLESLLGRAGFDVVTSCDGDSGIRAVFEHEPAAVVLDINMPGIDGWTVLQRIREVSDVPVLMLSASDTELHKVRGLRGGADDYITTPFGRQELVARIERLLARSHNAAAPAVYADEFLEIDFQERKVGVRGQQVHLTPLEFRLLATLVKHRGTTLSSQRIRELVWEDSSALGLDQVKLYVGYLRRRLQPHAGEAPPPITTVRGLGYRYDAAA
jgi:DNA-binding response OmpR family regulator